MLSRLIVGLAMFIVGGLLLGVLLGALQQGLVWLFFRPVKPRIEVAPSAATAEILEEPEPPVDDDEPRRIREAEDHHHCEQTLAEEERLREEERRYAEERSLEHTYR